MRDVHEMAAAKKLCEGAVRNETEGPELELHPFVAAIVGC